MKIKALLIIIGIVITTAAILLVLNIPKTYTYLTDNPHDFPEIVKRAPLIKMENDPNSNYILVWFSEYCEKSSYISDFNLLWQNREKFILTNDKDCYFTTCDSNFNLYKNGEVINIEEFITGDSNYNVEIEYGTLKDAFTPIDVDDLNEILQRQTKTGQ